MKRGLKLGMGIPMVIIGFFVTLGGIVLVTMVGLDGSFELPAMRASSEGHALLFDAIYVRGDLPSSGSFSATLKIEATGQDESLFVGVGPTDDVATYLAGVPGDRVVQVDWPGEVRTEPLPGGTAIPGPPTGETFWEASESGAGTLNLDWVVTDGDWTIVVMNADGGADVQVEGNVTVTMPALGPISVTLLVFGLVVLTIGALLTISGAKTPSSSAAPVAAGPLPPRPDA